MANFVLPETILHAKIKEYRFLMEGIIMQQNINHILNVRVNGSNNLRVIDYVIGLRNCVVENKSYCIEYYFNDLYNLSKNLTDYGVAWNFYLGKVPMTSIECEGEYYYFGGKLPIGICKPKVI